MNISSNKKILFFLSVAFIFILSACKTNVKIQQKSTDDGKIQQDTAQKSLDQKNFQKVPALTFKDYTGTDISFQDMIGTPMVINSWATWCPFCKKELPEFAAVQKEFGDKVIFIAVNRRESLKKSKQYTDTQGTSDEIIFVLDPDDSFYKTIGGISMPETIFVDSQGNITEHKRGPLDEEQTRIRVQKLINN